jgi:hypothetical protein
MLFPSLCVDGFFQNPDDIVKYANTLTYQPAKSGKWPGVRSEALHRINPGLHRTIGRKMVTLLYPNNVEQILYNEGLLYFHKVPNDFVNEGWVHADDADLTIIIYLSRHKNCGTSIYELNRETIDYSIADKRLEIFKTKNFKKEKSFVKENNKSYEETISFKSRYNRAVMFDSYHHHGAPSYTETDVKEDRLTLIGFYRGFNNTKFGAVELKRI